MMVMMMMMMVVVVVVVIIIAVDCNYDDDDDDSCLLCLLWQVPGSDWAVLKLGTTGVIKVGTTTTTTTTTTCPPNSLPLSVSLIQRIEVDTCHFKGNFPESCMVEGAFIPGDKSSQEVLSLQEQNKVDWQLLLARTKLLPDR